MINLSEKQQQCLDAIDSFRAERGYAPNREELANKMQVSVSHVRLILKALEEKGAIKRDPGVRRSLMVVRDIE